MGMKKELEKTRSWLTKDQKIGIKDWWVFYLLHPGQGEPLTVQHLCLYWTLTIGINNSAVEEKPTAWETRVPFHIVYGSATVRKITVNNTIKTKKQ